MSDVARSNFDNRDHFQDISSKPFPFEFPKVQELEGRRFVHVFMGLYKAEPAFTAEREWMERMTQEHPGLMFRYEKEEKEKGQEQKKEETPGEEAKRAENVKILYAYNREAAGYIMDCCRLCDYRLYPEFYPGTYPGYEQVEAAVDPVELYESEIFGGVSREGRAQPVEWGVMCYRWDQDGRIDKDYTGEYIRLAGRIGYLVEEGIYYFGQVKDMGLVFSDIPEICVDDLAEVCEDCLSEDAAGIGRLSGGQPSPRVEIQYLALNEKYYDRLKELCELLNMGQDEYFCFGSKMGYEELERHGKDLKESRDIDMSAFEKLVERESEDGVESGYETDSGSCFGAGAWNETETAGMFFGDLFGGAEASEESGMPDGTEASEDVPLFELIFGNAGPKYEVPEGAEELLQGRGFENITLAYRTVSGETHAYQNYSYAYKEGNDLVLVEGMLAEAKAERYDMQHLERLVIRERKVLNCNLWYPVLHEVIKPGRQAK